MAKWTLITWSENQTSSSCGAANSPETGTVCLTGADNDSSPHPPPPLPLPPPPPQLFLPLCLSRSCWHVERRQPCDRWRSPASTSWTFRLPWPVSRWCCSSSRVCTVTVTPIPLHPHLTGLASDCFSQGSMAPLQTPATLSCLACSDRWGSRGIPLTSVLSEHIYLWGSLAQVRIGFAVAPLQDSFCFFQWRYRCLFETCTSNKLACWKCI